MAKKRKKTKKKKTKSKRKKIPRKLKKKKNKVPISVSKKTKSAGILEKRAHPRLPICARVVWGKEQKQEKYFFTSDLSATGLFLITDHPPPVGEELQMELSIPSVKEIFTIKGVVARWEGQEGRALGCGVKFTFINPQISVMIGEIFQKVDFFTP